MNMQSVSQLNKILATIYVLYNKTHNYHWNLKGNNFFTFHTLFQKYYEEFAITIDELAERIKTLGGKIDGSLTNFLAISAIKEVNPDITDISSINKDLLNDFDILVKMIHEVLNSKDIDPITVDLLIKTAGNQEKNIWMLKSSI